MKRSLLVVLTCLGLTACATSPDDIRYVALGASDAVGVGADPPTEGYVFRIEDELEERVDDVQLVNLGVPGGDVAAIERVLEGFLVTDQDPDLVTLWVGPNDVIRGDDPEDFEGDLEDILEQLRGETDAVVVMANVPELTELPRFRQTRTRTSPRTASKPSTRRSSGRPRASRCRSSTFTRRTWRTTS